MSALPANFTHLHVHSHYSLLGATPSLPDLIDRARRDALRQLALTDNNALHGAVAFARQCDAAGIKPIIGMTIGVTLPVAELHPDRHPALGRLVLLATGPEGYRSLCRLSSLYHADADRERRRRIGVQWDELQTHVEGLICLTGGRTCWLERFIRSDHLKAARRYAARLGGLFGEHCSLGVSPDLMSHARRPLADEIIALGARFGLRVAAVQPVFCLTAPDRGLLRLLAAMDANCQVTETPAGALPDFDEPETAVAWPAPDEFAASFAAHPELLNAAGDIADGCGQALPNGRSIWPAMAGAPVLRDAAQTGLRERYGPEIPAPVVERLRREIEAIEVFGNASLFTLVADVVRFARSAGIPVSTRGSVANSLLAYCLGITSVDPIAHDLLFERFLNPARRSPPDIDLDFCSDRRDEVLDYVRRTYGIDHVALVGTMSTLRLRSAVRETGKAYGLADKSIDDLIGMLPEQLRRDPDRQPAETIDELLAKLADPAQEEVIRQAIRLVGQPHHAGLHPGGLVITPGPLTDILPVMLSPKGFLATQYEHGDVEAIGLPKLDLLGIRALTVLAHASELVRHHTPDFDPDKIAVDDEMTGDLLEAAETIGVFQCESAGARRTLRQLAARNVADLAIAGAFFKPGPAMGGMARAFVRRYRGQEAVRFLHPALEPILGRTKGVLLFQEQVLRLATEIAGLSWAQADNLRRGMSHFGAAEMAALSAAFIDGCCRPPPDGSAFSREQATRLWEQIIPFAGYGFNQGHATAYADVSYRSAYIKAHWPAEFLCARLADAGGFHHPVIYMAEATRLGITVRPPHVNYSDSRFTLTYEHEPREQPVLWMGLGQVRDLRASAVRAIVAGRQGGPYSGLADLLARVTLQAKEVDHLIRCGALDGIGACRTALLEETATFSRGGNARQMAFRFVAEEEPATDEPAQLLAWETELLGQPVSLHPLSLATLPHDRISIRRLSRSAGKAVTVYAVRLPGWPGGPGFFIGDDDSFAVARLDKHLANGHTLRPAWRPLRLTGRWLSDEWQNGWFQVESMDTLPLV